MPTVTCRIQKVAATCVIGAMLSVAWASPTVFASKGEPGSGVTPNYAVCSVQVANTIGSAQVSVAGGVAYIYLYKMVDSHYTTSVCGYKSFASAPGGSVAAVIYWFGTTGEPCGPEYGAQTGTGSATSPLAPSGYSDYQGAVMYGNSRAYTACTH